MTFIDIALYLEELAKKAEDGSVNPIEALGEVRMVSKAISAALLVIDPLALDEAQVQPTEFVMGGMTWRKQKGRQMFDYSANPIIAELNHRIKEEQDRSKLAAKMLSDMRAQFDEATGYVVNSDGDMIGVPAKITHSKDSLILTT